MANVYQAPASLSLIAPDIQAQQMALQRQQQMADAIRQQGTTPIDPNVVVSGAGPARVVPISPWQGLTKLAQAVLGGALQRSNDAQSLDLGRQLAQRTADAYDKTLPPGYSGGGAPATDAVVAALRAAPQAGDRTLSDGSQVPNIGPTNEAAAILPTTTAASQVQDTAFKTAQAIRTARVLGNNSLADDLTKQVWSAYAPTDATKLANAAGEDVVQANKAALAKSNYIAPINLRQGSTLVDPHTIKPLFNAPNNEGMQYSFDGDGNATANLVPGFTDALSSYSAAKRAGENSVEPIQGVDENGAPIFTNKLDAATGGKPAARTFPGSLPPPSAATGNPFQVSPKEQQARDADRLSILQTELQNPRNTPQDIEALHREIARTQGTLTTQPSQTVRPAAAPGYNDSQSSLATAAAKRYNDAIAQAAESPMRASVYDNILNLSKEGVATGPGQGWMNKVKGYVANTPFLSSVTGKWKDDVSGAQELNKFMYQNAQRNWQAAGGTGTDAQLAATSQANPNDSMYPKALQAMAQWGKAGELALQGKTNAMQQWKDSQGGNVVHMDQFDRAWRNAFAPQLYQLRTMDPVEAAQRVADMKKNNPAAYDNLMKKGSVLKSMGGL